jgi:hypothetical protein
VGIGGSVVRDAGRRAIGVANGVGRNGDGQRRCGGAGRAGRRRQHRHEGYLRDDDDCGGYYNIQFVRTGTYEITVSVTGFQTFKATGVQVTGNQVVRTDAALKVGGLTESVNVEAKAQLLTTDSATVSETIGKRAIVELPLNGHNVWSLAEHDSRRARGRQQRHRVELQRRRSARDSEQPVAGRHQLLGESACVFESAADCRRGRGSPRISPRVSAPPIV